MTRQTLAEAKEFVKILYYGDPGSGKTTSTASLAKKGKVVHVAADPGLKAKPLLELGIPIGNIEVERQIDYETLDKLFWELKGTIEDGNPDSPIGVLWDSVSEAHKRLLEQTAAKGYEKAQAAGKDRGRHDVFLEDYGTNTGEMRYFLRRFLDLECHVGFAALPRRDQDKDGAVTYGPDLTPALAMTLMGFVDIVCRTTVKQVGGENEEPEYWGQFRPVGAWYAKDRFHALPPMLINPTMDRVIDYVNGDLDAESDPDMEAARQRRKEIVAPPQAKTPATPPPSEALTSTSAAEGMEKGKVTATSVEHAKAVKPGGFKRVAK